MKKKIGEDRRDVLALVLGDGARIVFRGLVTGLAYALLMTRVIVSMLFGIGPHAPPTYAAVALLLALTAMLAVFFFKQKTAYEIGLGIPAEPLFRSDRKSGSALWPSTYISPLS